MPASSLSSTLPAEEPTIHHAPPLSIPSRNGNAPRQPPRSACPALPGVATSRMCSSNPSTMSPSGSDRPPPAYARMRRSSGALSSILLVTAAARSSVMNVLWCAETAAGQRATLRVPGSGSKMMWFATPAAHPSWSEASAVPTAPTTAARRKP